MPTFMQDERESERERDKETDTRYCVRERKISVRVRVFGEVDST